MPEGSRQLVRKDDDGRYHLDGTNVHEDFWGVKDGIMDLAAIRGTAPLAIVVAEILAVDAELRAKWQELLDNLAPYPMGYQEESKGLSGGVLADGVWAAGHLGEVDGQQAHSIEHLGCVSTVLQEGLLQSLSPCPGKPEVVNVFPAWPKEWDASFRLLARGGFLVTASIRHGQVEFVDLESRCGETCQIRNPWRQACRVIELDGGVKELEGEILNFETEKGKHYRLLPRGKEHPKHKIISPPKVTQASSYSLKLPNGTVHQGTLGRTAGGMRKHACR